MSLIELKVPDIGNYQNVDIIAVEIKPGDTVAVDDTLITLETDKAKLLLHQQHLLNHKVLQLHKLPAIVEAAMLNMM